MSYMSNPVADGTTLDVPFVNQELGTKTIDNTGIINSSAISKQHEIIIPLLLTGLLIIVIFE